MKSPRLELGRVRAQQQEVGRLALERGRLPRAAASDGPVAISQASAALDRGGIARLVLVEQREGLHVLEQVEGVVRPGPVGAEADVDAGLACREVGKDAAHRELQVGDRIGDHRRAPRRDQLELGVVEPDPVGEQGPRPQQSEPVEVRRPGGRRAPRRNAPPRPRSRRGGCAPAARRSAAASAIQRSDGSLTV